MIEDDAERIKRQNAEALEQRKWLLRQRLEIALDATRLEALVIEYEKTRDHVHGGYYFIGKECPGGDCLVHRIRKLIAAMKGI